MIAAIVVPISILLAAAEPPAAEGSFTVKLPLTASPRSCFPIPRSGSTRRCGRTRRTSRRASQPCRRRGSSGDGRTSEGVPATDIEGNPRPCGAGVDIGAYENGDCPGPEPRFRRGDVNADGTTDISDAIVILGYLFLGDNKVLCEQAGDVNDDGTLDISDVVYTLSFLFLGGTAIPPPVGTCGADPTAHVLPCESFPACWVSK